MAGPKIGWPAITTTATPQVPACCSVIVWRSQRSRSPVTRFCKAAGPPIVAL